MVVLPTVIVVVAVIVVVVVIIVLVVLGPVLHDALYIRRIQCLYSSAVRALCAASLPKWVPSPHLASRRGKHHSAVEYTKVSQSPHDIVTDVRAWLSGMGHYCTNQNNVTSRSLDWVKASFSTPAPWRPSLPKMAPVPGGVHARATVLPVDTSVA